MSINNVHNKTNIVDTERKVNALDTGKSSSAEQTVDPVDETFGIADVTADEDAVVEASPWDDYLCGDTQGGRIDNPLANDPGIVAFLNSFPPTWEEVRAGNKLADRYADVVLRRYEEAISDLTALKQKYLDAQFTGTITAGENAAVMAKLDAMAVALAKCATEKAKVEDWIEKNGNICIDELKQARDINGDGVIGRLGDPRSYAVHKTADGRTIYIDPVNGVALDRPPYIDPELEPAIAQGNLQIIEGNGDEGMPTANLTMQITDGKPNLDSKFDTAYEVLGTDVLWVKRDGLSFDGKCDFQPGYVSNDEDAYGTELHYELAGFEARDGKIVQTRPEDISNYMQVRVDEVTFYSWPHPDTAQADGTKEAGDEKGYDLIMECRDAEGTLIARFRITGYDSNEPVSYGRPLNETPNPNDYFTVDSDNPHPIDPEELTAFEEAQNNVGYRVYASTLGLAFNGENLHHEIKLDASGVKSTGRHIVEDLAGELGLPEGEFGGFTDERAQYAFRENMELFTSRDARMRLWEVGHESGDANKWFESRIDWNGDSGDYDCYFDPSDSYVTSSQMVTNTQSGDTNEQLTGQETISTALTGIMVSSVRGIIKGTNYNDIVETLGANDWMKDEYYQKLFPNAEPLDRDAPLATCVVDLGRGNNLWRGHEGNHYVTGASFAWVDGGSGDLNQIITQGNSTTSTEFTPGSSGKDGLSKAPVNIKNFVHVNTPGGETIIHNPVEESETVAGLFPPGKGKENTDSPWTDSTHDDYYNVSSGSVYFSNTEDHDAINSVGDLNDENTRAHEDMRLAQQDAEDAVWEAMTHVELPDNVQQYVNEWMEQGKYTSEVQGEMDDFFGTMFGYTDELWQELTEEAASDTTTQTTSFI